MTEHKIREAMGYLESTLVQEASQPVAHKRKRLRPMLVAACLAALCAISVAAVSSGLLVQFYHNGNLPDHIAAEKVDAYQKGDQVIILAVNDGWGKTDKGWINLDYVKYDQ
jgi:hypothetical protein